MSEKKRANLRLFLLTAVVVIIAQIIILQPVIKYQLIELYDDWYWMVYYKALTHMDFIPKMIYMWVKIGIHESGYAIFIGLLGELFGKNYQAYNYFIVGLKIISSLTLFPLVLVVFKNRLLAFLTTFLYAITSSSTGSLYWMMKGGTYLGTAFMNLFLVSYYFTVTKNKRLWLLVSSLFIFLAYITSAVRIYPIFLMILFIETYLLLDVHPVKNIRAITKSPKLLKKPLVRLLAFFLPAYLVASRAPISPQGFVEEKPFILLNDILRGNLHDLLSPFAGLGYSFFTNYYWRFFGQISPETFSSFNQYISFLVRGPILIFGLFTIMLALLISKNKKRFFIWIFSINLVFEILMYFIATYHFRLPKELWIEYDASLFYLIKYPTLIGIYALVVAFFLFFEWKKDRKNRLLLALWVGPLFSMTFLVAMWVTIGFLINAYSSTGYYFQIPSMGMSLFVATVLTLFYGKFKKIKISKRTSIVVVFGIMIYFYWTSSLEIARDFTNDNPGKVTVKEQMVLHQQLFEKLGDNYADGDLLVYFDLPSDELRFSYYRLAFFGFPKIVNYFRNNQGMGCIESISDGTILKDAYVDENNITGFVYRGECVYKISGSEKNEYVTEDSYLYEIDNFYAFKLENGNLTDVKENVLEAVSNNQRL